MCRKFYVSALLLCVCAVSAFSAEKLELKLRLNVGDKFKTVMVNDQQIKQTFGGMNMDLSQCQEMIIFSEVTDVNEDLYSIKSTYGDMKISMNTPQGQLAYDTANPDSNAAANPMFEPVKQMYAVLKGVSLITKIDANGVTKGVDGIDEMLDVMSEKLAKDDPNAAAAMKQMLNNFYNDEMFEDMSSGMYVSFPEDSVQVGDVWDSIVSLGSSQFPIDVDTTCVLADCNESTAEIEMNAKMDMGSYDGNMVEIQGMKMNMLLTGTMNGINIIDVKTGWLRSCKMDQSFSGSLKMEAGPNIKKGATIPMSIKGRVTLMSEKIE